MASTTTTKKEIVDFLWDWAEANGEWSKLLISKIVALESNLGIEEREEIFNYFLQSVELHSGLPATNIAKPTFTPTAKKIELETLTNITGVNKLAKNQTIKFSKNLTTIYGENGTGKTGYGRILKNLGFSYDPNNTILHDIYGVKEPKSAEINFSSSGVSKTFNWNGTNKDTELQNISVFNNHCVQISLTDRQLIVSPIGFHLFNLVTSELNELTKFLNQKIAQYSITLSWAETLTDGTPQQKYIAQLSGKSSEETLMDLSNYTLVEEQELTDKETELSNLNKSLLQAEIQNLSASTLELNNIKQKIELAELTITKENWENIIAINKQIADLEGKTQTGIRDIAEANGIEFYATEQFHTFINAAENYIKILNKEQYPDNNDSCVYCLQPLESQARELITSYRTLLNDKTQENAISLKEKKNELIKKISAIEANLNVHQATFGLDEQQKTIQPKEITEYNELLTALKEKFITNEVAQGPSFSFDYAKYITFLTNKYNALEIILIQKKELLANIVPKEKELIDKIAALKDTKILSTKIAEVKVAIENHKITQALYSKTSSFSTTSISRKTSDARQQLVEQNFNELFQNELKVLRKSDLPIQLSFGTDKGKSKISHRLGSIYMLADILSEGEQKAISLAEFLTELQLDNVKAPVIFDDPVNSLDHRIIDEVGKRLIELSKNRQVIIFTHSILFLNSLIQQSELDTNKKAGVQFEFHRVKNNFGVTGLIDEVEEINSFGHYTKKVQAVIDTKTNPDIDESKLAAEGYGHLRSAIEITVEDDLLKKTIKRYRKGVAFPALIRIDGVKLDTHKGKLNDIYEKCCVSISGHSSPEELHTTPTISELKIDFEEFKKIRGNFN